MQSLALALQVPQTGFVTTEDATEMELWGRALAALRNQSGLTQAAAGERFGISAQAFGKYETGKAKAIFHPETQRKLADAIGVSVAQLQRERDKLALMTPQGRARAILENRTAAPRALIRANDEGMPVRDRVQAGAWLGADDALQTPISHYHAARDPRFSYADQWLSLVVGDSVDRLRIFDGDLVQVVDAVAINYQFRTGDIVEVERLRFDGAERELTIKQVEVVGQDRLLWPRSSNPRWQSPLRYDDGAEGEDIEVRVRGLVVDCHRRLIA